MGLSSTTDKQKEAAWRVEFEALGEQLVFVKRGAIYKDEAKRQAALRWLSERARIAQLAWGVFLWRLRGCLSASLAYWWKSIECPSPLPAALVCRSHAKLLYRA